MGVRPERFRAINPQIGRLDQLHLRSLRKTARVRWQDRIPNTDILNTCGIMGIEALRYDTTAVFNVDSKAEYSLI